MKIKSFFTSCLILGFFSGSLFSLSHVRIIPEQPRKGEIFLIIINSIEKPQVFLGKESFPVFKKRFYYAIASIDVGDKRKKETLFIKTSKKESSLEITLKDYPSRVRKLVIPKTKQVYTKPSKKKNQANQKSRNVRKATSPDFFAQGKFILPVKNYNLDSLFFGDKRTMHSGKRVINYYHRGVDLAVPVNTKILASNHGQVVFAGDLFHRGVVVSIHHGNGIFSEYLHLTKPLVKEGNWVKKGQEIALSGNSGISTGPHLHWHITHNNRVINPLFWLFFNLSGILENPSLFSKAHWN